MANLKRCLDKKDTKLCNYLKAPITSDYRPELDISPELAPEEASLYQSLIFSLQWIVVMGHIDIIAEVSMLSVAMQNHLKH